MTEVTAVEAENQLGSLLDRVESGEEVVITRYGKPVARLIPNKPEIDAEFKIDTEKVAAALERIRARAVEFGGAFDWEEWKAYRDEGRR